MAIAASIDIVISKAGLDIAMNVKKINPEPFFLNRDQSNIFASLKFSFERDQNFLFKL